jgi:hypothetical protein
MDGTTRFPVAVALLLATTACSRDAGSPTAVPVDAVAFQQSEGRGVFHRYVAIGTSVSMGVQSDGVIAEGQENSWPAQLSRMAHRELTQPYIGGTGCRSPLAAPLASGLRISGEGAGQDASTLSCSDLVPGVELPVRNLAIAAARTSDALNTTPENITDAAYSRLYSRVLEPGQTQVSSMVAQNPKFVSVEFGGNEVLNARSGIAIPGATIVPVSVWAPQYDQVLERVASVTKMAVLVGLIDDVASFP